MDFDRLTDAQKSAITAKGNVLVAAAAGSGKTSVLVERVVGLISNADEYINADELLIVTFTNAAAAEMRSRIEKRLDEECANDTDNARLIEQKYLLGSAKICTIDSFCIDLVRENFERANVNPDFKIADETALFTLRSQAMETTISKYFAECKDEFVKLLDIMDSEYSDENFRRVINTIFTTSRNMPFPDVYLDKLTEFSETQFDENSAVYRESVKEAGELISSMLGAVSSAADLVALYPKRTGPYVRALEQISIQLNNMQDAVRENDWDRLYDLIDRYSHSNLSGSSTAGEPDLIAVKSIIEQVGVKYGKDKLSAIIFGNTEFINNSNRKLSSAIKLLVKFLKDYAQELYSLQKKENSFTFYNTEQLALEMLCEYKDGEIKIRDDAEVFLNRFKEVLVDEYQDTNDLQDMLFRVLSNKSEHLFAVGDVKQSIYAFRGANPNNFLSKKNSAKSIDEAKLGDGKKIILTNNFRSRNGVCEYINFIFRNLMTKNTGDIVYNDEECLVPTGKFPDNDSPNAELLLISDDFTSSENEDDEHDKSLIVEARAIAEHIKKIMSEGEFLRDKNGGLRKARFSDFAILMRNQKNRSCVVAEELRNLGIPVSFSKENFSESLEIRTFCSLLEVIDNPQQDIPLVTVMMSPIFGFSAEDMAKIRINAPKVDLISAVTSAANNGDGQCEMFLKRLSDMRNLSVTMPLSRFISRLLVMSDYLNIASAMSDGEIRRANLLMLVEYSASYSNGSTGSLVGFLRYLQKMPAGTLKSSKLSGGENCVKIMSMHSSKGLQFPICIICDLGVNMYSKLRKENVLFDAESGIGIRYFDEEENQKVISPAYSLLTRNGKKERLEEELRLLYVALTRAEERLVVVSHNKNLESKLADFSAMLLATDGVVDKQLFSSVSSMNDWILITSLLHKDGTVLREISGIPLKYIADESSLTVYKINPQNLANDEIVIEDKKIKSVDDELVNAIRCNIQYEYPFGELYGIESKTTVSRIANKAESEKFVFSAKPDFMERDGISATGRGTAVHKVMQFINFSEDIDIESEIERLVEWRFITETEGKSVDRSALKIFFGSSLYKRILKSDDVKREMRFLTEISAGELYESVSDKLKSEKIVVQGAVDLCFVEKDGVVIVDFKTDRVDDAQVLKEAYSEQLGFYSKACEKIFEKNIKQKIIYSFALGKEITI